jgi:hypothetical protein
MARKKAPRRKIPAGHETAVLVKSARRCLLCFHLNGDLGEKHGQVAQSEQRGRRQPSVHLPASPQRLDSTTRQHKNYTIHELKRLRTKLYKTVADGKHIATTGTVAAGGKADSKTLAALIKLMTTNGCMDWLRGANFAGWSFDWKRIDAVEEFASRRGPEYEFIDPDVEKLRKVLYDASRQLMGLLATETFPVGNGDRQAIPEEWESEQPERFRKAIEAIHGAADKVCGAYDELVRAARKKFLPSMWLRLTIALK